MTDRSREVVVARDIREQVEEARRALHVLYEEVTKGIAQARAEGEREGRKAMAREIANRMLDARVRAHNRARAFDAADFTEDLRCYADSGRWPDEQEGD